MQRESEVIAKIVEDQAAWKRVARLMPEASGVDPKAVAIFLLGLAVILAAGAAAQ